MLDTILTACGVGAIFYVVLVSLFRVLAWLDALLCAPIRHSQARWKRTHPPLTWRKARHAMQQIGSLRDRLLP